MTASLRDTPPIASARAHWTIYLPTLVVALIWAAVYGWAVLRDPPLNGLRALALAVEALAVPLLFSSALLRARILTLEVRQRARDGGRELLLRQGFSQMRQVRVGADEVAFAHVRRSLPQRFLGGGALDIRTMSGERFCVSDIDRPESIADALAPGHEPRPAERGVPPLG